MRRPLPQQLLPAILFLFYGFLWSAPSRVSATEVIEKTVEYRVMKGDYGAVLSGRLGMDWQYIAQANGLDPNATLREGTVVRVNFRRIVPESMDNGILINIADRTLYRFEKGKLKDYFFIAAGKPDWQTPLGEFTIRGKAKEPTWYVPSSIQEEMEAEGKEVLVEVPPGPDNPLGKYWLQLSIKGVGLHGTNAPQSIFKFRSHGCIRLRPEVAELLYHDTSVGTTGKIIYKPLKVHETPDGTVLIEVYRDFYKKGINYDKEIRRIVAELNVANRVDWDKIRAALEKKDGTVKNVSR